MSLLRTRFQSLRRRLRRALLGRNKRCQLADCDSPDVETRDDNLIRDSPADRRERRRRRRLSAQLQRLGSIDLYQRLNVLLGNEAAVPMLAEKPDRHSSVAQAEKPDRHSSVARPRRRSSMALVGFTAPDDRAFRRLSAQFRAIDADLARQLYAGSTPRRLSGGAPPPRRRSSAGASKPTQPERRLSALHRELDAGLDALDDAMVGLRSTPAEAALRWRRRSSDRVRIVRIGGEVGEHPADLTLDQRLSMRQNDVDTWPQVTRL